MKLSKRAKRVPDAPALCTHCKRIKEPHEYHKTKYGTLNSWCKACVRAQNLEYYNTWVKGRK